MAVRPATATKAPAKVLAYDAATKTWKSSERDLLEGTPPEVWCYIFLEDADWFGSKKCLKEDRLKILKPFGSPDLLSDNLCVLLNGYFGSNSSLSSDGKLEHLSTWFRWLTKKVLTDKEIKEKSDKIKANTQVPTGTYFPWHKKKDSAPKENDVKGYEWYEMGFFTSWSYPESKVLCIGTPKEVREQLTEVLEASPELQLRDPFALLRPLFDEVIKACDLYTWRATNAVRDIEKERYNKKPGFGDLQELYRHVVHLVEVEEVAIDTLASLARRQETNFRLSTELSQKYQIQAQEYLSFQIQLMSSMKARAVAAERRLESEITLAHNMLASSDNSIMKSITLLTMIFLPATFISVLFNTAFFSFDKDGWTISSKFWLYWAVVVPVTVVVLAVWWYWGGSYRKIRSRILHNNSMV
ncbi:uncharacterized protein K444DRAFT_622946 [Hyaloscypha bicolor E]|uniref:Uncharacterized protein n=1 Tax=Hyaloscypha bicolor E TaxID=1095630 RepID=A0A2J6SF35_9HELO|nr:uncharacterized protein K444DRAFT_622946 [Hyaloscypha bicolor E]PMD49385.1 hypothetical protein K444DRAFT_622946 [Hyaloscypha bicolor E]